MPRSRSRSPTRRDRERRRSRSRERRHRHRRSRSPRSRRSRSHSPRRRSRSASPNRSERRSHSRERDTSKGLDKTSLSSSHLANKEKVDKSELKAMPKDEQDMMKLMGFSTFETTKNKKVEGNDIYVTNLTRKRRYRQYMNRRGGFNRPLDFIA